MTKNTVGVNGIDPARQGIKDRSIVLKNYSIEERSIAVFTEENGAIEPLANRANAIRPYEIFRFR